MPTTQDHYSISAEYSDIPQIVTDWATEGGRNSYNKNNKSKKICQATREFYQREQQQKLAVANAGKSNQIDAFVESKPLTQDANGNYDTEQVLDTIFAFIKDLPIYTVITPELLQQKLSTTGEMIGRNNDKVITVYNVAARRLRAIQQTNTDIITEYLHYEDKAKASKLLEELNAEIKKWIEEDDKVKRYKVAAVKVKEFEDRLNRSRVQFLESNLMNNNTTTIGGAGNAVSSFIESRENEYYQLLTDKDIPLHERARVTKLDMVRISFPSDEDKAKYKTREEYVKALAKEVVAKDMRMQDQDQQQYQEQ